MKEIILASILLMGVSSVSQAALLDFSTITLDGTAPSYTFTDATLGNVSIEYSGGYQLDGITNIFGGVDSLGLGEISTNPGIVSLSWSNAISSLDLRYYDLDLNETATFRLEDNVSIMLLANPTNNNTLSNNVLSANSLDISNSNTDNYSELRITGADFSTLTIDFTRPGSSGGGSSFGFGNATTSISTVPVPAAAWLFGSALLGFFGFTHRKKRI